MLLTVQNGAIYLEDSGAGEPMLFLHGVPDSAEMWDGVIERLEGQYRCIAPDLPGLGRSVAPPNFSCSLEHMASFLDDLVGAINPPLPLNMAWPGLSLTLSMQNGLALHAWSTFRKMVTGWPSRILLRLRSA